MKNRAERAIPLFSRGCNCAQSVFATFAPERGLSFDNALAVACPFGAGMGRTREVCGALTGAFMAVGLATGMRDPSDLDAKEKTYALVQEMTSRFVAAHGSTHCKTLLGCDLRTDQGRATFDERDLHHTKCEGYVGTCAEMVEEMAVAGRSPGI